MGEIKKMDIMTLMVSSGGFLAPFEDLADNIIGNPLLIGAIIFLFFLMFAMYLRLPFTAVVIIMIPVSFLTFKYIPELRLVLAIMIAILVGLGLIKWTRK